MRRYLIPFCIFLGLVSCNKEEQESVKEMTPAPAEIIQETLCEKGVSFVKLSENLASQLEEELKSSDLPTRSSAFGEIVGDLGVTSFERLFPYDDKYEKRQRRDGLHLWYKLEFDEKISLTKASSDISSIPGVEIVEPQRKIAIGRFNDPEFSNLWGLFNEGKKGARKGFDINVQKVWENYTVGEKKVIVGVIDGGVQMDHPDLAAAVLPAGREGSRNFVDNNFVIYPHSHGTHVAGTIGAVSNNNIGVAGIAGGDYAKGKPGVSIMSCQIFKTIEQGGKPVDKFGNSAAAIVWAANHGAVISQNSWGYVFDRNLDGHIDAQELEVARTTKISMAEKEAVDYFIKNAGCDNDGNQLPDSPMKGGVVIFAAGNDNIPYGAPANYEQIIAVGAVDKFGDKSSFSNYGNWVDICAPGSDIRSTIPGGKYGFMSGTSMACPHVSGVAALVVSYYGGPGYTNEMLKEALLKGADARKVDLSKKIGPMLDALGAISYGSDDQPSQPEFTCKILSNSVVFTWKHSANSKKIGANGYRLVATKNPSLLENLNLNRLPEGVSSVNVVADNDLALGSELSGKITGLDFDSEYVVGVIAYGYGCKYDGKPHSKKVKTSVNHAPVIRWEAPENIQIRSFEQYALKIDASDEDGHDIALTFDPVRQGSVRIAEDVKNPNHFILSIDATTFDAGKYQIGLHASDSYGAKADRILQFEILPNRAPVKIKDFENRLATLIDEKFEYQLSEYISDPDEEELEIFYEVAHPEILAAHYEGGALRFKVLKYGNTMVTVRAKDMKGESVVTSFTVLARRKAEYTNMYPNPVVDFLNIRTGQELETAHVEIRSATGALVFKTAKECSAFEPMKIGVASLAPGRYQVKVSYAGKTEVKTIVKK